MRSGAVSDFVDGKGEKPAVANCGSLDGLIRPIYGIFDGAVEGHLEA
jgi:hypothetical protein